MKRIISIIALFVLYSAVFAQSIDISNPIAISRNGSDLKRFGKILSQNEYEESDEPIPFVMVLVNLKGDSTEIGIAQSEMSLEVEPKMNIPEADRTQEGRIMFLLPSGIQQIYVRCGDRCDKKLLHKGMLIRNNVYTCTLTYRDPEAVSEAKRVVELQDLNDELRQRNEEMQRQNDELKDENEEMQRRNDEFKGKYDELQRQYDELVKKELVNPQNDTTVKKEENPHEPEDSLSGDSVVIVVNTVRLKMLRVEGGTFRMGSETGNLDEKPVHQVTLSTFYIGETEVTQLLWESVMGYNRSLEFSDSFAVGNVSWSECQVFIGKLNALTGHEFVLPTESQWEFAARGGMKSKGYIYSGSDSIEEVAICDRYSSDSCVNCGSKKPNELGLYDMSGNEEEWCSDWYGDYPSSGQTDPTGPSTGVERVVRGGGCYCENDDEYRVSFRKKDGETESMYGFRLVLLK